MSERKLITEEVVALRGLGRSIDERWVGWAVDMLVAGHDTPSLRLLAGATAPFNQFEMAALVDRTLEELGVPGYRSREDAGIALAVVRARQVLDGTAPVAGALAELSRLCVEPDYASGLYGFYLLHYARDDLQGHREQYYWPGATRRTIDAVVRELCEVWLRDHAAGT